MINVKVIKIKDILKYLAKIVVLIAIIYIARYFYLDISQKNINIKNEVTEKTKEVSKISLLECIDKVMPNISEFDIKEDTKKTKVSGRGLTVQRLLTVELSMLDEMIQKTDLEINKEELTLDDTEELKQNLEVPSELPTQVLENSVPNKFTNTYGTVQIKNESKIGITEEMLNPNYDIKNKKDILIFHTHTCESYTPTEDYNYECSGNFRTTDLNNSVVRVGDELEKYLKNDKFNVLHDKTFHDFPAYSGSYTRSYATVENLLKNNIAAEIVFDIHRDAIGNKSNYAPIVKIGEEHAAQLMFVIGTNGGGLEHTNWVDNLKVAIKFQEKANEMYPGLFKPMIVRNSRYNQNLASGASIIEVGATGNTMEQCITSMKYLSKVIQEVMK